MFTNMGSSLSPLSADWPAPDNIIAFTSCRAGGVSLPPFNSFNMGLHVGDEPQAVHCNRALLSKSCDGLHSIQWLNQVHGDRVVEATANHLFDADACYTRQAGLGCAVMTADCLPVLICDKHGQQVAAVHAGWRGLATGVIDKAISTFECSHKQLLVWLGPAISRRHFEVGPEVRQIFIDSFSGSVDSQIIQAFYPSSRQANHYFADLYQLARVRLETLGVRDVYGGEYCCYDDPQRFFSYRRETETGRMVSLIYKCV